MAQCCQDHSTEKVKDLLGQAQRRAVLRSFSSDGTPLKTSIAAKSKVGLTQLTRVGMRSLEHLIRVCFYRYINDLGQPVDAVQLAPPVPLTHGKSVDAQFTAGLDLGPSLRESGHLGYAIEHTYWPVCL